MPPEGVNGVEETKARSQGGSNSTGGRSAPRRTGPHLFLFHDVGLHRPKHGEQFILLNLPDLVMVHRRDQIFH